MLSLESDTPKHVDVVNAAFMPTEEEIAWSKRVVAAFAGNPYLIDPLPLVRAGLLNATALAPLQALSASRVDFGALYERLAQQARILFETKAGGAK